MVMMVVRWDKMRQDEMNLLEIEKVWLSKESTCKSSFIYIYKDGA